MRFKPTFSAASRFAVASTVLLLAACSEPQQAPHGAAPLVNVVTVKPQSVPIVAELPGRVDAVREAQVRARVTGIVEKIDFQQGSDVKAGDLLFVIDRAPLQAAYNQADAQLKQAQASVLSARSLAERYAPLVKANAVSKQEYDNAIASSRQAEATVAAAKAALESARINLNYARVTSPINGRIGEPLVTEGALVEAGTATQMATVQQLDPIYVDFTQSTQELAELRQAFQRGSAKQATEAPVSVMLGQNLKYDHEGKLLFTGVTVDPTTGQIKLRAEVPNPDHTLLPGMYVRVRVEQGVDEKAILVPQQAVQRSGDGSATLMLVRGGDTIEAVPVRVSSVYQGQWIVQEGLKEGDVVVVAGFQKIGPGAKVTTAPWKGAEQPAQAGQQQPAPAEGAGAAEPKA